MLLGGRDKTHCYSSAMQLQRQGAMTTREPVERIKRFRNGRRLAACVWQRARLGRKSSCLMRSCVRPSLSVAVPSARNPESKQASITSQPREPVVCSITRSFVPETETQHGPKSSTFPSPHHHHYHYHYRYHHHPNQPNPTPQISLPSNR